MKKGLIVLGILIIVSVLAAAPALAQDVYCPESLPTRLNAGDRGQIAQAFSTLRYTPNGETISTVYAPAQFTVISKLCDGFTWVLQIQYDNGLTGWAVESQTLSEFGMNDYWLEPIDAPPAPTLPPPTLPTPSIPPPAYDDCTNALPSQLRVGDLGYVAQAFSTLRDSPAGAAVERVYAPATFQVVDGPVCAGNNYYYRIAYSDGSSGWALEGQAASAWGSNQYWLLPLP